MPAVAGHFRPDFSSSGTKVKLSEDEGALIYAELGIKFNQSKESQGPPGNLKIGGYRSVLYVK